MEVDVPDYNKISNLDFELLRERYEDSDWFDAEEDDDPIDLDKGEYWFRH